MSNIKLLHIYGQQHEHDSVFIVGNTSGLETLRQALGDAVVSRRGGKEVSVADGEGFAIRVLCQDADWQSDTWTKLAVPYTSESSEEKRKDAMWPEGLFEERKCQP